MIDIKIDDTNYDMFNKESILLGLLLVVKKFKMMPPVQSVQILDSIQNSIIDLLKYNFNEYIIEGVRKIVDVIIEDKEEE